MASQTYLTEVRCRRTRDREAHCSTWWTRFQRGLNFPVGEHFAIVEDAYESVAPWRFSQHFMRPLRVVQVQRNHTSNTKPSLPCEVHTKLFVIFRQHVLADGHKKCLRPMCCRGAPISTSRARPLCRGWSKRTSL